MAQISASMVKELRERTGVGMMECKKALQQCEGDMDAAIEHLRKAGQAKADKKASRTAAEGSIVAASVEGAIALVEVNCETDFVAKGDRFSAFADEVARLVVSAQPSDLEALMALDMASGSTVLAAQKELIAEIGEKIEVRRFEVLQGGLLKHYLHGNRIGVIVSLEGGESDLAFDVAMHIAASRPLCIDESGVPTEVLEKEREIFAAQAAESGKPAQIIEKMVEGKLRKYINEVTLMGQPFVKDPDQSVGKLLSAAKATVTDFRRLELGEGIEKKVDNFVEEVMAQARGGN